LLAIATPIEHHGPLGPSPKDLPDAQSSWVWMSAQLERAPAVTEVMRTWSVLRLIRVRGLLRNSLSGGPGGSSSPPKLLCAAFPVHSVETASRAVQAIGALREAIASGESDMPWGADSLLGYFSSHCSAPGLLGLACRQAHSEAQYWLGPFSVFYGEAITRASQVISPPDSARSYFSWEMEMLQSVLDSRR